VRWFKLASFTVASGACVQYDGKMLYGTGTYTVTDNKDNYDKSLLDITAGNITMVTSFTNNINMTEQYTSVDVDLSLDKYNSIASHKLFSISGMNRVKLYTECIASGVNAGGGAAICFGVTGSTSAFIASTPVSQFTSLGKFWLDATPAETHATFASALIDQIVPNGINIGYEISGSAPSGGTLRFHCLWTPYSPSGQVTAVTTGSALA
jgi:hypothetical protein